MKRSILVISIVFTSCGSSVVFDYKKASKDVFESSYLDIFDLLLDTIPSKDATFFLDTLSLEDPEKHLSPMKEVMDLVPDYWSKELVEDLTSGFTFNSSNFEVNKLHLEQRIISNPKEVESLVSTQDKSYYGRIRLSKFYYDESKKSVLFFIAVYCGNRCSEGGLVYVTRESQKHPWVLDTILEVWGSGQDESVHL